MGSPSGSRTLLAGVRTDDCVDFFDSEVDFEGSGGTVSASESVAEPTSCNEPVDGET